MILLSRKPLIRRDSMFECARVCVRENNHNSVMAFRGRGILSLENLTESARQDFPPPICRV